MADETTAATTAAAPATETTAATETAAATPSTIEQKTFTQADIDRIVKDRLTRAEAKAAETNAKAVAEAEAKALAEQGKFKDLWEKAQAQAAAKEARVAELELAAMRRDVASKTGLPAPLIDRLRGVTLEELEADAATLLAALPKPTAPNINSGNGLGASPAAGQMSEADKAVLAATYGVNPKYLK